MFTTDTPPRANINIQNKQSAFNRKLTSSLLKNKSNHMACLNKGCVKISSICVNSG